MEVAHKLRDTSGNIILSYTYQLIAFAIALSLIMQVAQIWTTITVVKGKTTEAVLAVAAINGSNVYNGIRESTGQARVINSEGTEWAYPVATEEALDIMVNNLDYDRHGNTLTKHTDTHALVYTLDNFNVTYKNVESGLQFTSTLTLEMPLRIGGELLPSLRIPIKIHTTYEAKF